MNKIRRLAGRSYQFTIDDIDYQIDRIGTRDDLLMFNFYPTTYKLGDYFITLHFFEERWTYRDTPFNDIIDFYLFYTATEIIDQAVINGDIPFNR